MQWPVIGARAALAREDALGGCIDIEMYQAASQCRTARQAGNIGELNVRPETDPRRQIRAGTIA